MNSTKNGSAVAAEQDEITVRVPPQRRYVGAVRSLATGLAVQSQLTVDEIEDVQMAIDEACALLLPHAERLQAWLDLRFWLAPGSLTAEVGLATAETVAVDRTSLSWTVLSALCDEVEIIADGQTVAIGFTKLGGAARP